MLWTKDALIMKFNASGDILAEKKYGGLFSDRLQSVTCLPDGGFAVTGWSLSSDGVFMTIILFQIIRAIC